MAEGGGGRRSAGRYRGRGRGHRRNRVDKSDAKDLLLPAPDWRRPAVHRRSRCVRSESRSCGQARRQHGQCDAQAPEAEEDVGQARGLRRRADPGRGVRRGSHQARQGESRQRDHRRDGLGRDDPDGSVSGHPEPRRRHQPDVERASDHEHQGQRLSLARLSVGLPAGASARAGGDRRIRQRQDRQRRRTQRRLRYRAPAALYRAVQEARRKDRRDAPLEPGPGELRHRGGQARDREPGRVRHHRFPGDLREVRAVTRSDRKVGRLADT